ncbi:MAG TPA: hypothetical protein PKM21_10035 [Anaerolineales bacterium]|nr:hypothetical protein [Anaerolineales bacterium]
MKHLTALPAFTALAVAAVLVGLALVLPASATPAAAHPAEPAAANTAWNSGWVNIAQGQMITLTHNLGGDVDDYAVEMWFLDTDNDLGMNRRNYGGAEAGGQWYGAHWERLTNTTISVYRQPNDNAADRVRLLVYIPEEEPDYDSGWTAIDAAETIVFHHNLGLPDEDLVVNLWFRGGTRGINQYAYGGLVQDAPPTLHGAYWHNLLQDTVSVTRLAHASDATEVRVTVSHSDPPDYDSDWQIAERGVTTFTHDLNWPATLIMVRADCRELVPGGEGIHQHYAGGNEAGGAFEGASVQNLTNTSIQLLRWPNDTLCPSVRLRMWIRSTDVFLPIVLKSPQNFRWLEYDDGGYESDQSNVEDGGFAVRFNTAAQAQLMQARMYFNAATGTNSIDVHVWDSQYNELITPIGITPPAGRAWYTVDFSSLNLMVNGDFYVGYLYSSASFDPSIGVDNSSPDGHSFEVPWELMGDRDYMIRVALTP